MDIIQDVLIYQTQMMRNSSLGPYVQADFSPPDYIVVVNALFYASLGCMILAAFIAMLIISWVREFDRRLGTMSIPEQRAKTREFRYLGMERWKLREMVAALPLLIQISLLLFSLGLIMFLFHISTPSFGIATAIFGVGFLYYAATTTISVFVTSSPFHSPLSRALSMGYRRLHAYFCPSVDKFLSRDMDTGPITARARLHRGIQIFLRKYRPYREKNFEKLINSATMDEVQLEIAASAIQRIHKSVPNSQHGESLLCSVWQVAGSTVLRKPPSFDLPSWVLDRGEDGEYFSRLPKATLVDLVAVSLRAPSKWNVKRIMAARPLLQCMHKPELPWAQVVISVFDRVLYRNVPGYIKSMVQTHANDLTDMIRRDKLQRDDSLWLLGSLSGLRSEGLLSEEEPFLIGICLAILSNDAPKWDHTNLPDIVLLEAVVTLAALSCSPDKPNPPNVLISSREHPWLLSNFRNPTLVFEGTLSDYHEQLISLLFLVLYALIYRESYPFAVHYFTFIKKKGDLPLATSALATSTLATSTLVTSTLTTSALTTVAPYMRYEGLLIITRMLVAPDSQELLSIIRDSMSHEGNPVQSVLLEDYDNRLDAGSNPDPNIFAILLILSKHLRPATVSLLGGLNLHLVLKNPWLRLAAGVIAQLNIPEGPGVPTGSFNDDRVHNMIAALFLRYTQGKVTKTTNLPLLGSFLKSREVAISSVALKCYMEVMISRSDSLPPSDSLPSDHLAAAVSAVFNFTLPDHQLWMGWEILNLFVREFEKLSIRFRQTFAEAFFTSSRRPLLRSQRDMESSTPELEKILTWEYFHEKEQGAMLTDSAFSGLDWMAMAWSLHLSKKTGKKREISGQGSTQPWHLSATAVDDELVLRALFKLLNAARHHQIVPIIPTLREFVHWFDDTDLPEFSTMIFAHIEEALGHRGSRFSIT